MRNNIIFINASKWPSLTIKDYQIFSPNPHILEQLRLNPQQEFWHTMYTEFACIIINNLTQTVCCIRDHFGLEPFFYHLSNNKLIFGSNLPDIIEVIGYTPKINKSQIIMLLLNCYTPAATYSDETNLENIFRVEPGCILEIIHQKIKKTKYWQLDLFTKPIIYSHAQDYLEHFTYLLNEGIKLQLNTTSKSIAAEFSGGLDSSTIVTGLINIGIKPNLFMHIAPPNSEEIDDMYYASQVIAQYNLSNVHYIDAKNFDFTKTLTYCSKIFAGTPQYLFPICANNIHQSVAKSGNKLLFSGFGGDECVSGHAPLNICLREYLHKNQYYKAWHETNAYYINNNLSIPNNIRKLSSLVKAKFPGLFDKLYQAKIYYINRDYPYKKLLTHNVTKNFMTLKKYEHSLLQGTFSHHVRLRIEESAIIAKQMGFQYKYPLLYPKLVEFCNQLPLQLKRNNGENRILIRNYLRQYLPKDVYKKHQKIGSIMPATINKIKQEYAAGNYKTLFTELPFHQDMLYLQQKHHKSSHSELLQHIFLSGLKIFIDSHNFI